MPPLLFQKYCGGKKMGNWKIWVNLALVLLVGASLVLFFINSIKSTLSKGKRKALSSKEKAIFWLVGLALSALQIIVFGNGVLTTILVALLLVGFFLELKAKTITVLSLPAVVGIIANVIFATITNFNKGKSLYWLIVPAAVYLILWFYSQMEKENAAKPAGKAAPAKPAKKNFDFVLPLALTAVFAAGIVVLVVFMNLRGVI